MKNTMQSDESTFRRIIKAISRYIPQVEKPKKKITLNEKFVWSGIALFAYLIMGQIPLYGVTNDPKFDFLAFARVIFVCTARNITRTRYRSYRHCWIVDATFERLRTNQAKL